MYGPFNKYPACVAYANITHIDQAHAKRNPEIRGRKIVTDRGQVTDIQRYRLTSPSGAQT